MNWEFILKYLPLYKKAAWLTLRLGLLGVALSTLIGLACAAVRYYRIPVLRRIVSVYIELSRNTPLLIQLFFIYYGLPKLGIQTDPAHKVYEVRGEKTYLIPAVENIFIKDIDENKREIYVHMIEGLEMDDAN